MNTIGQMADCQPWIEFPIKFVFTSVNVSIKLKQIVNTLRNSVPSCQQRYIQCDNILTVQFMSLSLFESITSKLWREKYQIKCII